MHPVSFLATAAAILLLPRLCAAGENHKSTPPDDCCKLDLWTGRGVSLGGILFPELNYQAALGSASTDPESLAVGHHDPDRHGITQQTIEFALGVHLGEHVRLFGNYSAKINLDDRWEDEFEEYYAIISGLPADIRLRGGRFYPVFGMHNTEHHHSIFFVGEYLTNGRFVGEDHLTLYGGEISTPLLRSLPAGWSDKLTSSFGAIPVDRPEEHEEEAESLFEAEGAAFQDWAALADYTLTFRQSETTSYQTGISGAWGHNRADRFTQLYALHFQYLWRPHGADPHTCCSPDADEFLLLRAELMLRDYDAQNEDGDRDSFTSAGINTSAGYGFKGGKIQTHLRAEYASGTWETGQSERWRISPVVIWRPSPRVPFHFKVQYNYDHSPAFGGEHSIWAQFSLRWGDCCVHDRHTH